MLLCRRASIKGVALGVGLIVAIQGCSNRLKTANSEPSVKGKRLCVESNRCCAQRFRVSKDVKQGGSGYQTMLCRGWGTKECCAHSGHQTMQGMLCREVQGTKQCCAEVRKRLNFKTILLPLASPPHRESTTSNALCSTLKKKRRLYAYVAHHISKNNSKWRDTGTLWFEFEK